MGRKLGTVALFLGAFLIVLAALSKFYMYDRLAVAPANTQTTSTAETLPGADAEYLDVAAGLKVVTGPLKNTKVISGDVAASKKASKALGRDIDVWNVYDCTDKADFDCGSGETPLSGTTDRVAFDANTGETVAWKDTKSVSGGETIAPADFKGLYFKFPFDAQKKTYGMWDGTVRKAIPTKYVGEGVVKGLKAYKFEQTVAPVKTGTIDVPGSLVGSDETTVTADQIYSSVSKYSVEPVTGVILIGESAQDNYLELNGERVLTTTKATLRLTDKNTTDTVNEYKSKVTLLKLVKTGFPIGGGIAGLILLVLGGVALRPNSTGGSGKRAHADLEN